MANEVGIPVMAGSGQMENANPFQNKRKLIRSVKNPIDKCTIVSIFPKEIIEIKCTIEPGRFQIAAGSLDNPAVLTVGPSSWWRDNDAEQPLLEIPVGSIQIAESVVNDYCNGMLGCNMSDSMPGLFYVPGTVTSLEIKTKYKTKLSEVDAKQNNWYRMLVRLADSLWSTSNNNPIVIAEDMRLAARSLNMNDKPWLRDFQTIEKVRCMACGSLKEAAYPVCPICKAVDNTNPLAKDLKFAV